MSDNNVVDDQHQRHHHQHEGVRQHSDLLQKAQHDQPALIEHNRNCHVKNEMIYKIEDIRLCDRCIKLGI